MKIVAGKKEEIVWGDGNWIFLDIQTRKASSCGLLIPGVTASRMILAAAATAICSSMPTAGYAVNLMIESPLSGAFDADGRPIGRKFEKAMLSEQPWYSACSTNWLVGASTLVSMLHSSEKTGIVRVFEGLVVTKRKLETNDPIDHVERLSRALQRGPKPDELFDIQDIGDRWTLVNSAFAACDFDPGVPAIFALD